MPEQHADPPSPDDPRLRIPDVLREAPPGSPRMPAPVEKGSDVAQMARAWAVALDFVFTIIAGGGLGYLFDWWRKTSPIGLLVGLGLGFVIAFMRIIQATQRQEREDAKRKQGSGKPPAG